MTDDYGAFLPYRPFGRHCICRGDCGRHPGPAGTAMTSTRAVHSAVVGRDAHIAPRYEGGTVKTVPYNRRGGLLRFAPTGQTGASRHFRSAKALGVAALLTFTLCLHKEQYLYTHELDCFGHLRAWAAKSFALAMTRLQAATRLPSVIASPVALRILIRIRAKQSSGICKDLDNTL